MIISKKIETLAARMWTDHKVKVGSNLPKFAYILHLGIKLHTIGVQLLPTNEWTWVKAAILNLMAFLIG